jgi:outer membrane protein OmpA-like peptidoglycan-associated protein
MRIAKTICSRSAPVISTGGAFAALHLMLAVAQAESVPDVATLVQILSMKDNQPSELQDEDFELGFLNQSGEGAGRTSPVNTLSLARQFRAFPAAAVDVRFSNRSAVVNPGSVPVIEAVGRALTNPALGKAEFVIVDHTNTSDNKDADLALSQRRAEAIRVILIDQFGISDTRITATGFGEEWIDKIAALRGRHVSRIEIVAMVRAGSD